MAITRLLLIQGRPSEAPEHAVQARETPALHTRPASIRRLSAYGRWPIDCGSACKAFLNIILA